VSLIVGKLFYLPLNLTSSILHSSLYFLDPASQRDQVLKAHKHSKRLKKAKFEKQCEGHWRCSSIARYKRNVIQLGSERIDRELDISEFLRS